MLPRRIIPIENPDKEFHEQWHNNRSMLNFPHPFRLVALGPPNCGKSTTVKNILLRAHPPFQEIFIIHCDPPDPDDDENTGTKEYDDIDCEFLDEIPSQDEWQGDVKTLVILDDLEFKQMDKDQKRNLNRLFGYASTHKNLSVALCSQDPFEVPPIVRRCSNVWVLWRMSDMDAMALTARRTGLNKVHFKRIFDKLMLGDKDSLWIDMTEKSPFRLRKNGFECIKRI